MQKNLLFYLESSQFLQFKGVAMNTCTGPILLLATWNSHCSKLILAPQVIHWSNIFYPIPDWPFYRFSTNRTEVDFISMSCHISIHHPLYPTLYHHSLQFQHYSTTSHIFSFSSFSAFCGVHSFHDPLVYSSLSAPWPFDCFLNYIHGAKQPFKVREIYCTTSNLDTSTLHLIMLVICALKHSDILWTSTHFNPCHSKQ